MNFNRVFHYFHHPFWGYHYFWKDPYSLVDFSFSTFELSSWAEVNGTWTEFTSWERCMVAVCKRKNCRKWLLLLLACFPENVSFVLLPGGKRRPRFSNACHEDIPYSTIFQHCLSSEDRWFKSSGFYDQGCRYIEVLLGYNWPFERTSSLKHVKPISFSENFPSCEPQLFLWHGGRRKRRRT